MSLEIVEHERRFVRLGRRNQVDLRKLEKVLVRSARIVDHQSDASSRQDDIAHQTDPVPLRIDGELQRAVSLPADDHLMDHFPTKLNIHRRSITLSINRYLRFRGNGLESERL